MEVGKKPERKMVKRKISKTFCCQSDSTFTNSPNLDQSYKNTSKKTSVYDVRKRKKNPKKGKRERSTCEDNKPNKIINCVKTFQKTLNNKILKQQSYYSDGIKDLPGNGKKQ
jgi:hypothetical protein